MPEEPEATPEEVLLQEVKEALRIEWTEEDARLGKIIKRGKGRLKGIAGPGLDFEEEGLARDLLLSYCRYAYNNALEYFEENFSQELTRLQVQEATKGYKNREGDA